MSRILAIDYLTSKGHRNFNKIHIDSLVELGNSVHLVGREEAFSLVKKSSHLKKTILPRWASLNYPFRAFTERLKGIFCMLWLHKNFNFNNYDYVLFLSYDILSLFVLRSKYKFLLINHNNVSQLDNKIKLFLTRTLPSNYLHIALSHDMKMRLEDLLSKNKIYFIPHGYEPSSPYIKKPSLLGEGDRFIFCGINNNYDMDFIENVIKTNELNNYLKSRCIKLLIKKKMLSDTMLSQIISFDNNITDEEYNFLIQKSIAVLLPYSNKFKYRCSGMLFECIAAEKPVIATNIQSMQCYRNKMNIFFFSNTEELITCIDKCSGTLNSYDYSIFAPLKYWHELLSIC